MEDLNDLKNELNVPLNYQGLEPLSELIRDKPIKLVSSSFHQTDKYFLGRPHKVISKIFNPIKEE